MKAGTVLAVVVCVGLGWVALTAAEPQTTVALTPAQAGGGPSLQDTTKFIEDKLGNMGAVTFTEYISDHSDLLGTNRFSASFTFEISNVHIDQGQCTIAYHAEWKQKKKTVTKKDYSYSLRDHPEVAIKPYELHQNEFKAHQGMSNVVITATDPQVTVVVLGPLARDNRIIPFLDQTLATRIGKALNHAAELCSGSKQEPFVKGGVKPGQCGGVKVGQ
jgi:hypothetical protein